MGSDKRPCMEPIKPKTPGPGRYGGERDTSELRKTGSVFGRAEKRFDIKKLGRFWE